MSKVKLIPKKRFQGFEYIWRKKTLDSVANNYDNLRIPVTASDRLKGETPYYGANGIQDYVDGFTHNGEYVLLAEDGANDLRDYPVHYVSGQVWVNNHAHVLQGNKGILNNYFLMYRLKSINMEPYLVGGGRAKLNANIMMNIDLSIPQIKEQEKIGKFFKKTDKMILLQQSKVNKVKDIKSAYLSEMFPKEGEKYPKKRFEGFTEPWEKRKLGLLLNYEQPTDYLVSSDAYDSSYTTPVLTAGKSFLLGYTNEEEGIYQASKDNGVIIFDDFTTSSHFVNFNFKVKSSAMKFLRTTQSGLNLYFLYNLLNNINYNPESHERHWISIFSEFEVLIPGEREQQKIANFFKNLDNQISNEEEKLEKLEKLKQAYLNDMFV